jgi:hypothetical protein
VRIDNARTHADGCLPVLLGLPGLWCGVEAETRRLLCFLFVGRRTLSARADGAHWLWIVTPELHGRNRIEGVPIKGVVYQKRWFALE